MSFNQYNSITITVYQLEFTCSWDWANFSDLRATPWWFAVYLSAAPCCLSTPLRCCWHGACKGVFPRLRGIRCSAVDLGVPVPHLELPASGTFAHRSRGAVGRLGIPGLNSFGERNLGLRTFWPFTSPLLWRVLLCACTKTKCIIISSRLKKMAN